MRYLGNKRNALSPSRLFAPFTGTAFDVTEAALRLAKRGATIDRAELCEKFAAHEVVDYRGVSILASSPVQEGDAIFIHRDPIDLHMEIPQLRVLWESDTAIIVDKPAGLSTIPRGQYVARSVVVAARRQFANDEIVAAHRLDKLTRGCVLLVKEPRYRGAYQRLFQGRDVNKQYVALSHHNQCESTMSWPVGEERKICLWMAKQPGELHVNAAAEELILWEKFTNSTDISEKTQRETARESKRGRRPKFTITRARLVSQEAGGLRWELMPETGFTHQLRAALNYCGFPLLGDPLYPRRLAIMDYDSASAQLALCAKRLEFVDPVSGKLVRVESGYALDFSDFTGPNCGSLDGCLNET